MSDERKDGLSIRYIRQWPIAESRDRSGVNLDIAFSIAMSDERDVTFVQKLSDAHAFLKSRIH